MASESHATRVGKRIRRREIAGLARKIAHEFHPERIILFGSYAYGKPTPDSDVDLLVIMPFEGESVRTCVEIRMKTRPKFPLDLLVRTREKVRERIEMDDWFMQDIVEKGITLYEAADGGVGVESRR